MNMPPYVEMCPLHCYCILYITCGKCQKLYMAMICIDSMAPAAKIADIS